MARKLWVALHRYLGLAMLLFLLVIAFTGSVLVFAHEIDAWLNPRLLRVEQVQPALGADELTHRIQHADPRLRVSLLPLSAPAGSTYEVRVVPRIDAANNRPYDLGFDRLYVDPGSGKILGQRQWGALRLDRAHLIPFIDVLHRRLQLPGQWGMWLTGTVAIVWLVSSLLGAWLTLPRMASWRQEFWNKWKPAWSIKRGASATRVTFDLHRSVGLWSLPFALMLGISGVYFSLADEVFKPVVNWFSTVHQHPARSLPVIKDRQRQPAFGIDEAVVRARARLPAQTLNYQPWYANHLAKQGVYRIAFKEPGMLERAFSLRYEQVYIDDQTGELRALYGYHHATNGERFVIWQYPLHTGRILALWGRIAVFLAGVATCVMAVTGLMVWRSRSRARADAVKAGRVKSSGT
ncbi:PepSY domain-containing protein (plasmid) [Diaphorobacter sp. HDW4B]|uniref:PepSY-associated TM helix domain-containing protein n=1 Tax=Diaphorobacter sp. HDW4B TaxID=2714925 RepID=UPI00140B882A|nr:PepSY-associated TM helix domain-containing protein [Diaphorobacter sp. HDW4B]QIL74315.1 PepSY domain-containing protein [Diaphorobacter sp. HDW4B]